MGKLNNNYKVLEGQAPSYPPNTPLFRGLLYWSQLPVQVWEADTLDFQDQVQTFERVYSQ